MKLFRNITLAVILMVAGCQTANAQYIQLPKAYMFGFVASFNDSTVYFTDIQELDSIYFTKKKKLLVAKGSYSSQLRDFFTQKRNLPNRTCIVVCSPKKKTVEKKYAKMKKKYITKDGKYDVRYLPDDDFHFMKVDVE